MAKIFITGDTHGSYTRFDRHLFPEQKKLTKDDVMIIAGDFGIWHDDPQERYNFDLLSNRKFTTLFVDGNHENYDRFCTESYLAFMKGDPDYMSKNQGEFPLVEKFGGVVQEIRPGLYHALRGQIYEINGKRIFTFGGAQSHDIQDGILDPDKFDSYSDFRIEKKRYDSLGKIYRINHLSWWKEELPSDDEMQRGRENLEKANWEVDFVVTHGAPFAFAAALGFYEDSNDTLTKYLSEIFSKLKFKHWYFGHYHEDTRITEDSTCLYRTIMELREREDLSKLYESLFGHKKSENSKKPEDIIA